MHAYSYNYGTKQTQPCTNKKTHDTHIQNQTNVHAEVTKTENDEVLFGKQLAWML